MLLCSKGGRKRCKPRTESVHLPMMQLCNIYDQKIVNYYDNVTYMPQMQSRRTFTDATRHAEGERNPQQVRVLHSSFNATPRDQPLLPE